MRAQFYTQDIIGYPAELVVNDTNKHTGKPDVNIEASTDGRKIEIKLTPEILNFLRTWRPNENQ